MQLRDYQQDLLDKVDRAFRSGYRRPLVVAPCGAGKSYLFVAIARQTKGDVLILTHRQEIRDQHEALIAHMDLDNVRVAMVLTEVHHLGEHGHPSLIVSDEAHLSRSNSWTRVIQYYNTRTVGLTATPCRLDGKPLGDIYDILIDGVDTRWLIDHNRLAPYKYYAPTLVDVSGLRTVGGDYVVKDLDDFMAKRMVYGDVVGRYQELAGSRRAIAYCVSVNHAKVVAGAFSAAGIRSAVVSSNTPKGERHQLLADFRRGVIQILCNVGIISEGISIDDVECCLLLRPTESVALGIQQMMRCMRYLPGKQAIIIDYVANYTRVGLPDDARDWSLDHPIHKRKTTDGNGNFPLRCCPNCYMTFPTAPVCPYCGTVYPLSPREIEAHEEIRLREITAEENRKMEAQRRQARMEQGRAQSFEDLIRIGRSRGYKNPAYWAARVMRGRR